MIEEWTENMQDIEESKTTQSNNVISLAFAEHSARQKNVHYFQVHMEYSPI